jgi:hypothetical protein
MKTLEMILLVAIAILVTTPLLIYTLKPDPKPVTPQSNFTVVDTYKGCDVVRWALPSHAEYKYFLHCKK